MGQLPAQGIVSNIYSEFVVSGDNSEDEHSHYISAEHKQETITYNDQRHTNFSISLKRQSKQHIR
jgi:hypothetical protein